MGSVDSEPRKEEHLRQTTSCDVGCVELVKLPSWTDLVSPFGRRSDASEGLTVSYCELPLVV